MSKNVNTGSPVGISAAEAGKLQRNADKTINIAIYIIATLAALTVAVLAGLVFLQSEQNTKIDSALKQIHIIAVENHSLSTGSSQSLVRTNSAVIGVQEQLNASRAVENETLYRVKQIEIELFGYLPNVPSNVILQGQVTKGFNGKPIRPVMSNQPNPSRSQSVVVRPKASSSPSTKSPSPKPSPAPSPTPSPIPAPVYSNLPAPVQSIVPMPKNSKSPKPRPSPKPKPKPSPSPAPSPSPSPTPGIVLPVPVPEPTLIP